MAAPKKRNTYSRTTVYSRKSVGSPLRRIGGFSFLQISLAVVVVALGVAVANARIGSSSSAASLTAPGVKLPGLIGSARVPSTSGISTAPVVGDLKASGTGLQTATGIKVGNVVIPAQVTTDNNGNSVVTGTVPTTVINNAPAGNSGKINATPVNSAGTPVGNVASLALINSGPKITDITVAGSSATVTGYNLTPGAKARVGHSTSTLGPITTNADGSQSASFGINVKGCIAAKIPVLNRICSSAGTGGNSVSVTNPNGATSNSLSVNLSRTSSAPADGAAVGALGGTVTSGSSGGTGGGGGGQLGGGGNGAPSCDTGGLISNIKIDGKVKIIHPSPSDTVSKGNYTIEYINPPDLKPSPTQTPGSTMAWIYLVAQQCIPYAVQHYDDCGDQDGGAQACAAHDKDNDRKCESAAGSDPLPGGRKVILCGESEYFTPNGQCDKGQKDCDNGPGEDGFQPWGQQIDQQDQDGLSSGMGCAVLQNFDKQLPTYTPNVDVAGADIKVNLPGCIIDPPAGQYKVIIQIQGYDGHTFCDGGHCTGRPATVTGLGNGITDWITVSS